MKYDFPFFTAVLLFEAMEEYKLRLQIKNDFFQVHTQDTIWVIKNNQKHHHKKMSEFKKIIILFS